MAGRWRPFLLRLVLARFSTEELGLTEDSSVSEKCHFFGCCCVQIPDLDTEWGGWYFFTLSLIPRDTRGWEGDAMLVNIIMHKVKEKNSIFFC